MSGDRLHSVEHVFGQINITDHFSGREAFKKIYDWINGNGTHFQMIALHYGDTGTGTDHHDGANPFGDDAFFVFRMPSHAVGAGRNFDVYCLVQAGNGITMTGSLASAVGGVAAKIQGQTALAGVGYIGMSIAVVTGGNPWNGGTAIDGTDLKGDPVWVEPGGQSMWLFPRSIASGGTYAAKMEDTFPIYAQAGNSLNRFHMIADLDTLVFAHDANSTSNDDYKLCVCGPYTPHPDITHPEAYRVLTTMNHSAFGLPRQQNYGETSPLANQGNGGVGIPGKKTVRGRYDVTLTSYTAAYQPNALTGKHDLFPGELYIDDTVEGAGLAGVLFDGQVAALTSQMSTHDTSGTLERVSLGDNNATTTDKLSVKWDGVTTPGTGANRDGVQTTVVVP